MKSLADNVLVIWDEVVDTTESAVISPRDEINYWLIAVILLALECLLLLVLSICILFLLSITWNVGLHFHAYCISIEISGVREIDIKNHTSNFLDDMICLDIFFW